MGKKNRELVSQGSGWLWNASPREALYDTHIQGGIDTGGLWKTARELRENCRTIAEIAENHGKVYMEMDTCLLEETKKISTPQFFFILQILGIFCAVIQKVPTKNLEPC